uniref:LysM domain-containing protein n=1 Tax=Parascaris univalens TaxID=6257 RepID=A0A915ABS3_PARUN
MFYLPIPPLEEMPLLCRATLPLPNRISQFLCKNSRVSHEYIALNTFLSRGNLRQRRRNEW